MVATNIPSSSRSSSAQDRSDFACGLRITDTPLGFAAGDANLFRYVGNDPTGGVDPDGLQATQGQAAKPNLLQNVPQNSKARHHLGIILQELFVRSLTLPGGANQCHRWVEAARDIIFAHGKEWYENEHYKIEYIEWRFPPHGGWVEHGGLRITFANGEVVYLDNGAINGTCGISYPADIPKNWRPTGVQPLDKPKGKPPYVSWEDLKALPGALKDLIFGN